MNGRGRGGDGNSSAQGDHPRNIRRIRRLGDITDDDLVHLGGRDTPAKQGLFHRDPAELAGMDPGQGTARPGEGSPQALDHDHRTRPIPGFFPAFGHTTTPTPSIRRRLSPGAIRRMVPPTEWYL